MGIQARLIAAGATTALTAAGVLIYPFEGEVKHVYADPVGILTGCIGHVDSTLKLGQYFTELECTTQYLKDLRKAQQAVQRCTAPQVLPAKTEAAFISFTFNVGSANFCTSTAAKLIKRGDLKGACQQLPRWVYAKGVKLPGLITRRKIEMTVCLEGVYETVAIDWRSVPQPVLGPVR